MKKTIPLFLQDFTFYRKDLLVKYLYLNYCYDITITNTVYGTSLMARLKIGIDDRVKTYLHSLKIADRKTISTHVNNLQKDIRLVFPDGKTMIKGDQYNFAALDVQCGAAILKWGMEQNMSYAQLNRMFQVWGYFYINCFLHKNHFNHSIEQIYLELGGSRKIISKAILLLIESGFLERCEVGTPSKHKTSSYSIPLQFMKAVSNKAEEL